MWTQCAAANIFNLLRAHAHAHTYRLRCWFPRTRACKCTSASGCANARRLTATRGSRECHSLRLCRRTNMRQCSGASHERLTRRALASRCVLRAARRCRRSSAARSSSAEPLPPEPNELLLGHRAGERGRLPNTPWPGMGLRGRAQIELSAAFAALQRRGSIISTPVMCQPPPTLRWLYDTVHAGP